MDLELLRKYDRPGPRYTSYPTAVEFHEGYAAADYVRHLKEADQASDKPLSLYVHFPFCSVRCHFCGCNVVIAREHDVSVKYLDYVAREIDMLAAHMPNRRRLTQYHWGGGTPTYQSVEEMRALHGKVTEHFTIDPDAEVAVEVDPRITTAEQLEALKEMGFNRMSLGVQDFTPEVQEAIGRHQTEEQTTDLYRKCRDLGFESVNLDLVYGLPAQRPETFSTSLDVVLGLRPDRVALYSYAHLPKMRPNQKRIEPALLPTAEVKLQLLGTAMEKFEEAGYARIGMDHFALPEDELFRAVANRTLHRNFMGYTVRMGSDLVGVGISAIGDVTNSFAQNERKLNRYYSALDEGRFPIERGYELDKDDVIRRAVILGLMCNFHVERAAVEERFGIDFGEYFATELAELTAPDGPQEHGFVEVHPDRLEVVGDGQMFVRNVSMVFDRYMREKHRDNPIFSRTV